MKSYNATNISSLTKKQSLTEAVRIITTMDGVPITKNDGSIMQFLDTKSCRDNTKNRTFKYKVRHHSRGLTTKQFHQAQKEFAQQ
jgi:hypothetical protein